MDDSVIVSQLVVHAHVGVPAAERGVAQRLTISLRLVPKRGLAGLADDIANTVDYAAVCTAVRHEAESRPRKLIETLAGDIASLLLARFAVSSVEVEVRKYVIPGAEYVAVTIRR